MESFTKKTKVEKLCKIFGYTDNDSIKNNSRGRHATVKTLSELSVKVLMSTKVSKHAINVSYAEYIWQDRLTKWYASNPNCESIIYDLNIPDYWFYVPEFSTVCDKLEVKCIDSSHLLTRTRRKL